MGLLLVLGRGSQELKVIILVVLVHRGQAGDSAGSELCCRGRKGKRALEAALNLLGALSLLPTGGKRD